MEYNTTRSKLLMPEYGRNVQKMIEYLVTVDDREKRLRQAEEKKFEVGSSKSAKLVADAQKLLDSAAALTPQVAKLRDEHAYGEALALIATLRPTVDTFFDKVMVLDPDPAVRGAQCRIFRGRVCARCRAGCPGSTARRPRRR